MGRPDLWLAGPCSFLMSTASGSKFPEQIFWCFVAFNWGVIGRSAEAGIFDLPRFYTSMDVCGDRCAVIVFNVVLRRMKTAGREVQAAKLDNYALKWIYPLAYAAIVGFAVTNFLVIQ